jgi:bifunctional enzyme CysN/CysC
MELLRFATAGSVDDGKSTLIGRLLYDSKSIFEDQLEAVERTSHARGDEYVDLALLTDGLRAEREQGITIDVAYRYFATPKRTFIIADTPGHTQHTRNMVTGCSTADLVVVLVDARNGMTEQTRRHLTIASLLGIGEAVLCVNKMDLVHYSPERFAEVRADVEAFAARLSIPRLSFIPISALRGDNVVERSSEMPWFEGVSLLQHLEDTTVAAEAAPVGLRFPVQWVIRPRSSAHHDFRGYAGQVVAGSVRPGDEVLVLPSGLSTTVEAIETADGPLALAAPPRSVVLRLVDELDISRGDLVCDPASVPAVSHELTATVCWMAERPLRPGAKLAIKHTTRWARVLVDALDHRLDINSLQHEDDAGELALNDIGQVQLRTTVPLFVDPYRRSRPTGSFVLVDEQTNATVAAGLVECAGNGS